MTNNWIQTYTGRCFDPFAPDPDQINIVDIAWGLSMKCRYNGACLRYYSVAEHSVVMSRWFATMRSCIELQRYALLHDANEAYLPDIPRPIKRHPSLINWRAIEDGVDKVVFERFGLAWPAPPEIGEADGRIIFDERPQVMRGSELDWRGTGQADGLGPLDVELPGWSQQEAAWQFLARFHEVF